MQSATLISRRLDEPEAADRLQMALETVCSQKSMLTGDLGGSAGEKVFTDAVIAA